jgi:DNA-binding transcriptional MerR regulator
MAASIAAPVYTQLAEIKAMLEAQATQLSATVTVQDQRFSYVLNQLGAFLDKDDARHLVYDQAEQTTLAALTSVAHRLDEITSYVQQSVTIAREALTVSKENGLGLGKLQAYVNDLDQQHGAQLKEVVARLDRKRELLHEHSVRLQKLEDNNTRLDALEAAMRRLAGGGSL